MLLTVAARVVSALVIGFVAVAVGLSAAHAVGELAQDPAPLAPAPSHLTTAEDWHGAYGGDLAVYRRILARVDCAELLAEYDQATEVNELVQPGSEPHRHSTGYQRLAERRLHDLDCL